MMDTTNPHYLSGFVRESVAAGLSLDTTMKLVKRAHDIHLVNDPSFVRGFQKEAAGLLDSLKTGWDGLSPEAKGGLAGAGIGGLGGFMFGGEHPFRNALLGAAGGGAAGYGLGHVLGSKPAPVAAAPKPHDIEGGVDLTQNIENFKRRAQLQTTINDPTIAPAEQLAAQQELDRLVRPESQDPAADSVATGLGKSVGSLAHTAASPIIDTARSAITAPGAALRAAGAGYDQLTGGQSMGDALSAGWKGK